MALNKLNTRFSPAQEAAINAAIAVIKTNFPFAQNLTEDEKLRYPTINNERLPYVKRTVEIHAPDNPNLVSGFAGTMADAENDWAVYNQFENFLQQLLVIVNMMQETQWVAGAELYSFFREVYATAKRADANLEPGAKAVVDDIRNLFAAHGPKPQPGIPFP